MILFSLTLTAMILAGGLAGWYLSGVILSIVRRRRRRKDRDRIALAVLPVLLTLWVEAGETSDETVDMIGRAYEIADIMLAVAAAPAPKAGTEDPQP